MALQKNPNICDTVRNKSTYLTEKWFETSAMEINVLKHKHTTIPPIKRIIGVKRISCLPIATYVMNLK